MVIRESCDSIEVVVSDRVPDYLSGAGDTRLTVTVQSRGFVGAGSAWVEAPVLVVFVGQLRQLEARRQRYPRSRPTAGKNPRLPGSANPQAETQL